MNEKLKSEIKAIKVIDHHAHCFDAFYWEDATKKPSPFPPMYDFPVPGTSLTKTNILLSMLCEMYDRPFPETEKDIAELREIYETSLADEASLYNRMVDLAGIELVGTYGMSRPALPAGLDPERFRVFSPSDGLLIPLDNSGLKKPGPRCQSFVSVSECSVEILKEELNWNPTDFDDYLKFVSASVRWCKDKGAIAFKSSCNYWRGLDFDFASEDEARIIYNNKDNSPANYKKLQDFLQVWILRECGQLGIPFHMHTGPGGQQGFGALSNPNQLEKLINQTPTGCTFIMLHGGYPYCSEAGSMVASYVRSPHPLYLDTSMMWMLDPLLGSSFNRQALREWLEWGLAPRLIFGSDGLTPFSQWLSLITFRDDLTEILSDMVEKSMLSMDQALEAAYQILRGNAENIYNFKA